MGEEEWAARLTRKANEKGSNKTQRKAAKRERRAEWRAQLLEMTDADARLAAQSARAAAAEGKYLSHSGQDKYMHTLLFCSVLGCQHLQICPKRHAFCLGMLHC